MRVTGSRAYSRPTPVPKMPAGLVDLMDGMTKEILKRNPTNVYEFCAAHMARLLEIRDGSTVKRICTLDEKIIKAQNKVKLRAQKRRQNYDKEMQLLCDKGEKVQLNNAFVKGPLSYEIFFTNVEEIDISQKPDQKPLNLDSYTKNDEIERKVEIIPLEQHTPNVDEHDTNDLNESNNHDNILDKEPILEQNSDVSNRKVIGEADSDNTLEIKENVRLSADTVITTASNDNAGIVLKKIERQENKDLTVEITPIIVEETESELKHNADNIENTNNKVQEIQPEIEQQNSVNLNNDLLYNSINMDPKSKDDYNCINNDLEDTNIICENDLINNSDNIDKTAETSVNDPHIKDDFQSSSLDKTVNLEDFAKKEAKTNNDISPDNVLHENNTQEIVLSTCKESTPLSHSFDKEILMVNNQDTKSNNESEIHTKIYKPDLNNDMPPVIDNIFENSSDTVSNNIPATNNMDLETAAITIQKVFRSFLFKSRASTDEVNSLDDDNKEANGYASPNMNKERRSLGITRMDTMLQTVNEEKSLSLSTDDSSTLSSAATIIQAHIRGFLTRNKLNSNKTISTNSLLNSEDPVTASMENDLNQNQCNSKTILNIHIVPEGEVHLSRDESVVTSMDLSLDGSPPSSINLHPLGYDKSEPRKQLKREDAVQSVSPPSNNSGKLSEDIDSTKEVLISEVTCEHNSNADHADIPVSANIQFVKNDHDNLLTHIVEDDFEQSNVDVKQKRNSLKKMNSDEMDVVTPFSPDKKTQLPAESSNNSNLLHSGELHDVVLPTNVSRSSTSVVRGE